MLDARVRQWSGLAAHASSNAVGYFLPNNRGGVYGPGDGGAGRPAMTSAFGIASETQHFRQESLMTRTSRFTNYLAMSIAIAVCATAQSPARAGPPALPEGAVVCVACHGSQGEGSEAEGAPLLAGQNAQYLEHALTMLKAGTRLSPVMEPIARGLSDAQIHELTSYFAGLQGVRPPAPAASPADLVQAGKELVQTGAMNDPTPPCVSCHGIDGRGVGARFPSIAGQPATFLVNRLNEFQARAKAKAPEFGTMTEVATHLNEKQIRQVAAYLSTLPPSEAQRASTPDATALEDSAH
jgi:cytochrome c553